jgi:hypothetical protein
LRSNNIYAGKPIQTVGMRKTRRREDGRVDIYVEKKTKCESLYITMS